jgi:Transposase DDE domain
MRVRRETVEHPFATLKMRMGATHFLMKTLPKVATEMALHVLAYNLTRVMNIVGVKPLSASNRSSRRSGLEERVPLCAPRDRSGRSAWREVAPGLTPDSMQKK